MQVMLRIEFDGDALLHVRFKDHMWGTLSWVPGLHACEHKLSVRINAFTRM